MKTMTFMLAMRDFFGPRPSAKTVSVLFVAVATICLIKWPYLLIIFLLAVILFS